MADETLNEMLLPSGLAVRFADMDVNAYLDVQEAATTASAGAGGEGMSQAKFARTLQIETCLRCLRAYAMPEKLVPETQKDNDGKVVETGRIDVDKTLDAIPAGAWKAPTRLELMTKGPANLLSILSKPSDFMTLYRVIQERNNGGASPLPAKTRSLCVSD